MSYIPTPEQAEELVRRYNKDPFHLHHALTVEGVMRYFAEHNGFAGEADFWGIAGLLHDVDFERFPEEHCRKAPELLAEINAPESLVHAVCSHGWDITVECTISGVDLSGTVGTAKAGNGYLAVSYTDDLGGTWTTENINITASANGKVTVTVNKSGAKFMKVKLSSTAEPQN